MQTTLTDTQTFTYDAMGNPTSYDGTTLTWEGKQLSGAGTTTFSYDENGLRTRKTVNGTVTDYYYNGSVLIGMVTGTGSTAVHQFFSYDASGNVVSVDYSSDGGSTFTTYYYLRNGQNDVVKLIDNSGNSVVEYTYDTWGKVLSCTGTLATTLGLDQPFRYRGYVYDTETGWYYLQSRYYSPETCRFISADVLLSTGQGVLGHNSFAYCLGNPVNRVDAGGAASDTITSEGIDSDGDGDIDYHIYTYTHIHAFFNSATTIRAFIFTSSDYIVPADFDKRTDIIIVDVQNDEDNPTLIAMQAHKLRKRNRKFVVEIMLRYCEDMDIEWERTRDSLMIEWDAHMKYWPIPSAINVDFDKNEEGFTYEDYDAKAMSRLWSMLKSFFGR